MKKVNIQSIDEESWLSPKGTFARFGRQISKALGREQESTDAMLRHPFDVELTRVPAGKKSAPYHSHSAQWEFFYVISGTGFVRVEQGLEPIGPGDAFLFPPGSPHQVVAGNTNDLVYMVVADNPFGESVYYPDSAKWGVRSPARRLMRGDSLDYYDGEE